MNDLEISTIKRVIGVYSTVRQADQAIKELQLSKSDAWQINLLIKRQEVRTLLTANDRSPDLHPNFPTAIRRGSLAGILGEISGIGAVHLSGLGPVIITGDLFNRIELLTQNLNDFLKQLNFSDDKIDLVSGILKAGGAMLLVQTDNLGTINELKKCLNKTGVEHIFAVFEDDSIN